MVASMIVADSGGDRGRQRRGRTVCDDVDVKREEGAPDARTM